LRKSNLLETQFQDLLKASNLGLVEQKSAYCVVHNPRGADEVRKIPSKSAIGAVEISQTKGISRGSTAVCLADKVHFFDSHIYDTPVILSRYPLNTGVILRRERRKMDMRRCKPVWGRCETGWEALFLSIRVLSSRPFQLHHHCWRTLLSRACTAILHGKPHHFLSLPCTASIVMPAPKKIWR
jgi:hypothetical protein